MFKMEENRNITTEEYTDKNMQVVTQLAYMNFNEDMIGMSIGEILNDEEYHEIIYDGFMKKFKGVTAEENPYESRLQVPYRAHPIRIPKQHSEIRCQEILLRSATALLCPLPRNRFLQVMPLYLL